MRKFEASAVSVDVSDSMPDVAATAVTIAIRAARRVVLSVRIRPASRTNTSASIGGLALAFDPSGRVHNATVGR